MLLSEPIRDASRSDIFGDTASSSVSSPGAAAGRALSDVRRAISALCHAAAAPQHDGVEPRGLAAHTSRLAARISDYQCALAVELGDAPAGRRPARARALLCQHVAFVLDDLVAQLSRQQHELTRHGEDATALRKTWSLAVATSVAVEHLADDLARFRTESEPRR